MNQAANNAFCIVGVGFYFLPKNNCIVIVQKKSYLYD